LRPLLPTGKAFDSGEPSRIGHFFQASTKQDPVRAYLVPRFGNEIAEDIKPLDIQRWFKSLHETGGLAWTTIAKMRGVMSRIYKVGILHEHGAGRIT